MTSDKPTKKLFDSISLQRSLVLNLALLIAATSAAILGATYFLGARQSVAIASKNLIKSTNEKTADRLQTLMEDVSKNLLIARQWGGSGSLDLKDPALLSARFIPMLSQYAQVSSMLIANERGEEWMMLRDGNTWRNRLTRADEWGPRAHWMRWDSVDSLLGEWDEELDYDARRRPWFQGAMGTSTPAEIFWTTPYTFFTTKDPGITASTRFSVAGDTAQYVLAFDVLLLDISLFTTSTPVGQNGMCLVLSDDGRVVGLPAHTRFKSVSEVRASVLQTPSELNIPVLNHAYATWKQKNQPSEAPYSFHAGGQSWWGAFKPFAPSPNREFWIAAFVPESDFGAGIAQWRNYVILVTVIALIVAILMAIYLARKYGLPLRELAIESRRVRDLALAGPQRNDTDQTITFRQPKEAGITEIDELADDIEEMSTQLEAKSRELAEYNRTLERRVAERTKDLNEKNQELSDALRKLKNAQQQLILKEKMASLGNLVAGVAHEINNPIGAIRSAADLSKRCMAQLDEAIAQGALNPHCDQEMVKKVEKAVAVLSDNTRLTATAVSRIAEILGSLKSFSRLDSADYFLADLHEGIESTLVLVAHLLKDRIEVVRNYGNIPRVRCYPNQINQVFMNLFVNSSQAIVGAGKIIISTSTHDGWVKIEVTDTGRGIPKENLDRIFDPGFTTKGVGVGTGLGLAISFNIIDKHKGRIWATSEVGQGATFAIELPVEGPETEQDRNARRSKST